MLNEKAQWQLAIDNVSAELKEERNSALVAAS